MRIIFMSDKAFRRLESYHRDSMVGLLRRMDKLEDHMSALVDQLVSTVKDESDVVTAAVNLLNALFKKLQDGISDGDIDQIKAVVDEAQADSKKLADAIVANTPAVPAPAPAPVPEPVPAPAPTPTDGGAPAPASQPTG